MTKILFVFLLSCWTCLTAQTSNQIAVTPTSAAFGELRLGTEATINIRISNIDIIAHEIRYVELRNGAYFIVLNNASLLGLLLSPGASTEANLRYDASRETQDVETDFDFDTLRIHADCGTFNVAVSGVASEPMIEIEDFAVGVVDPGTMWCKPNGLVLYNAGSDSVTVTGYSQLEGSHFSLSNEGIGMFPFTIVPKGLFVLPGMCYQRNDIGSDSIVVSFYATARLPKDTSIWTGRTAATSVQEQSEPNIRVAASSDLITVSWEGAGVSYMSIFNTIGEVLESMPVSADVRSASIYTSSSSHPPFFLVVYNSKGEVLHREVCR